MHEHKHVHTHENKHVHEHQHVHTHTRARLRWRCELNSRTIPKSWILPHIGADVEGRVGGGVFV